MRTVLIFFLCTFYFTLKAQNSYIQVISEPDVSVFIDGVFQVKTNVDLGGAIIENVVPGKRIIKLIKAGFNQQEDEITLKPGEVYAYKVRPFIPTLVISESGNSGQQEIDLQVGTLIIQSLPISINISIPSLSVNVTKSKDEWKAEKVPVGNYSATFNGLNNEVKFSITIRFNQTTHLMVNMMNGKVEENLSTITISPENISLENQESSSLSDTFTDIRDNRIYKTIKIGSQVWIAENLSTTIFNDGTSIPLVKDNKTWMTLTSPGYCWYKNDAAKYKDTYGALYNWYAVSTGKLCPQGWHVPTDKEWSVLIDYLGGEEIAGRKLKESSLRNWPNLIHRPTNEIGFTALPSGHRRNSGPFNLDGVFCGWWCATEYGYSTDNAVYRSIGYAGDSVYRGITVKRDGFSVRCIKN